MGNNNEESILNPLWVGEMIIKTIIQVTCTWIVVVGIGMIVIEGITGSDGIVHYQFEDGSVQWSVYKDYIDVNHVIVREYTGILSGDTEVVDVRSLDY